MKRTIVCLLLIMPFFLSAQSTPKFSISGSITDKATGETLIGASISFLGKPTLGVTTNAYGFYSIRVPADTYALIISYSGYSADTVRINLAKDVVVNRSLSTSSIQLQEVIVRHKVDDNVLDTPVGVQRLSMEDIKAIPVLLGERDVLKTIQLLPGIKSGGDGKAGFYVRGGGADQNLILLDEATVYNAAHLFGFFSVFNSDAIKDLILYKGGMPASYGGRLASVEDIKMKDGSDQKLGVSGGVGLIASRITVEGPIVKDKGSVIISARRSYADLFTGLASDTTIKGSKLYFYDVNIKANYRLNASNRIYLSGYFGQDVLQFKRSNGIDWGNQTATLRWNHIINSRLFSNTSLIYSNFSYNVHLLSNLSPVNVTSQITDYHIKQDFSYYLNARNRLDFGLDATYHITQPGQAVAAQAAKFNTVILQKKYALESALYISNGWTASPKLKLTYGLRLTSLAVLGPGSFHTYTQQGDIATTTQYGKLNLVKNYLRPEPRIAVNYQLNEFSSVKASYDRNVQNIHLLNNTTSTSPTSIYLPTSNLVKPEIADQIALGYYHVLQDNSFEFSTEFYYKQMQNQIDYKNGANLVGNDNVEADLLFGKGRAYGWESFLKKKQGKLTGWISYTLSRTERQIEGINNGAWYAATQDQTHNIAVVGIYQASRKWTLSATWVYNTGNAVTWPSGKFPTDGVATYYYASRNGYRLPAYSRLDIGATLVTRKTATSERSWTFSIYNAYGRANPYTISFQQDPSHPDKTQVLQTTLFKMVPSVTYNFKF